MKLNTFLLLGLLVSLALLVSSNAAETPKDKNKDEEAARPDQFGGGGYRDYGGFGGGGYRDYGGFGSGGGFGGGFGRRYCRWGCCGGRYYGYCSYCCRGPFEAQAYAKVNEANP